MKNWRLVLSSKAERLPVLAVNFLPLADTRAPGLERMHVARPGLPEVRARNRIDFLGVPKE